LPAETKYHFFLFSIKCLFFIMNNPLSNSNQNEQTIAASAERFRALVTATADIVYSMSPDWRVMRQLDGRGFLHDTTAPTADWLLKYIHPEDQEKVKAAIDESISEKKIFQMEHRVLQTEGSLGWTLSRAVPILNGEGEIIEWFGMASDITEQKRMEAALNEEKEQSEQQKRFYETITSSTPDLIYVFDMNYRFTYANKALLNMWGKTWDNAIGRNLLENGYEPWHAEMHEREIDQIKATKQPIRGEVSFQHATLGTRFYDYIFTPVFNERGEVEAIAGTTRDITERKEWEQKLESSSKELQSINEEMASSNEELASTNEELAATNEELTATNEELLRMQHELKYQTAEKQEAIDRLNANEQNIRNMVRQAPVGMCIVEGDPLYVVEVNDIFLELIGKTREELKQRSYWEVNAEVEEYYKPITDSVLATGLTYHAKEHEITLVRNGLPEVVLVDFVYEPMIDFRGKPYAIMIVAIDITDKVLARRKVEQAEESLRMAVDAAGLGTYYINATDRIFHASPRLKEFFGFKPDDEVPYEAAINQIHPDFRQQAADLVEASFTRGERFDMEYPVIGYHDGSIRWVRGIGTMQHYDGKDFFTGVLHDITESKQDEMRKNDFIAMVSHELKTPLTSLNAIIQVANAKTKTSEDQFLASAMNKANAQVKRMSTMINGFLNISRLESGKIMIEKSHFNIEELVREIIDELEVTVTSHCVNLIECAPTVIHADRDKINSVISNLISNAVKYSPKDTTIRVSCTDNENEIIVSVSDEGIGIEPSDAAKIFDRYYRVESNDTRHISGFGIGLYLSAEIIERHGGKIWLESEPLKGSTFYFSLPL
jgi:PAS domain S-box-containing protein